MAPFQSDGWKYSENRYVMGIYQTVLEATALSDDNNLIHMLRAKCSPSCFTRSYRHLSARCKVLPEDPFHGDNYL